jgi:hypothetical protein
MSERDNRRKHDLECLRLASDCMQLADDVDRPVLRSHFIRMAREWTTLAEGGPKSTGGRQLTCACLMKRM